MGRTKPVVPADVPHGRASTYQRYTCRCAACRAAATEKMRAYRRATKYTESVLVPLVLLNRAIEACPEPLATQLRSVLK